jgi:hypothetical protein
MELIHNEDLNLALSLLAMAVLTAAPAMGVFAGWWLHGRRRTAAESAANEGAGARAWARDGVVAPESPLCAKDSHDGQDEAGSFGPAPY